jgi:hypothetical protein
MPEQTRAKNERMSDTKLEMRAHAPGYYSVQKMEKQALAGEF